MADNGKRLKLAVHKSFNSVKKALSEWERVNASGLESVKEIGVLGETLRSCLDAAVERTKVVQSHPNIKEKLLLKLESDIETERSNLTKIIYQLGTISNKVSNESSLVYDLYSKLIDTQSINSEDLETKTETSPSLSQMIVWLSNIDREIETAYVIRKFVTETTNFRNLKESNSFLDTWNNVDYLPPINEESYDESEIWSVKAKKPGTSLEKRESIADKFIKERDKELKRVSEAQEAKLKIWKEKKEKRKQIRLDRKKIQDSRAESSSKDKNNEEWQEIKPLLTINDHLQGPVDHGKYGPKTEVEIMIDQAIEEGDFGKAEQLSDHLADRKFAVKIANAFEAKRFLEKKTETDAAKKAKKRKKLYWGFEVKQKWQMKANM